MQIHHHPGLDRFGLRIFRLPRAWAPERAISSPQEDMNQIVGVRVVSAWMQVIQTSQRLILLVAYVSSNLKPESLNRRIQL